jgi:hypothetical protein
MLQTHTLVKKYVLLFRRNTPQQWLHERTLLLRFTYIAGRVKIRKVLLSSRNN